MPQIEKEKDGNEKIACILRFFSPLLATGSNANHHNSRSNSLNAKIISHEMDYNIIHWRPLET